MNKNYFFDTNLRFEYVWKEVHHFRGGSIRPNNQEQISKGLQDLSKESIRNRFLGSKRAFSDKELRYLTEIDGKNHYAFGVEEKNKSHRGVGIIRLVRSEAQPLEGEIAITIIDEYQKLGLGKFLMNIVILAAYERGINCLSLTFLPHNTGIEKLARSFGVTTRGEITKDFIQLYLKISDMDLNKIKKQLMPYLPEIETFHLET